MKLKPPQIPVIEPRLRIRLGDEIALGPGKIKLLDLVHRTGSIREAAIEMEMSYMRAWTLIRTMNICFREPLVFAVRGGSKGRSKGGGGARLTETGLKVLELYHQMNAQCLKVMQSDWKQLQKLLT